MAVPDMWLVYLFVFVFWSGIGSFLNVVIWRVPRGESIVKPPSHCPKCGRGIRPWENIPILSYILLRGKCAGCHTRISLQYPLVEALTGGLAVLMLWKFGLSWEFLIYTILSGFLVALSGIDIATMRLPNVITLAGGLVGVGLNLGLRFDFVWMMLLGGGMGLLLLAFMGIVGKLLFRKDTLGMGDVKLAVMIGLFVGPWHTVGMFVLGVAIGAVVGIVSILTGGRSWGAKIPFGPFLAAGVIISLLWGSDLWRWYGGLIIR